MTGPEHYREAERVLAEGIKLGHEQGPDCGAPEVLAAAQVHATLALAASFAEVNPTSEWHKVASAQEGATA